MFRPRPHGRRRLAAVGAATAPVLIAVALVAASGARPAAADLLPSLTPTASAANSAMASSSSDNLLCPTAAPGSTPTPTPIINLCPSPSPTAVLPTDSPSPSPTATSSGGGGGGGGSGHGGGSGSGSSSGGAGATPTPAGNSAPPPTASTQQLVGALVVSDPLLASQVAQVLQHPVSQQRPDLLHFSVISSAVLPGGGGPGDGGSNGPGGANLLPAMLLALGGACMLASGAAALMLGRLPRRIRLALALAPIAAGIPLSAAAAASITVAPAAVSSTAAAPAQLASDSVVAAPTLGDLRAHATRAPQAGNHAWATLVNIEQSVSDAHAQLATAEQQIAQLSVQLKQPSQLHSPRAIRPNGAHILVGTLQTLMQVHQQLASEYEQSLQREYEFFITTAKSPAQAAQVQAVVATAPADVRKAVAYDLNLVRTQLAQEAAINTATNAPGAASASQIAALLARGPVTFHAPVGGVVSQPFGPSSFSMEPPITYNGVFYPHFHTGLDIAAPRDTPVGAAAAGVVVLATSSRDAAGNLVGYGNYVVIRHANGYLSLYGHLDQLNVTTGQVVSSGQVIGLLGSTGWSTGPHLHFEIRVNGVYVDPAPFIAAQIRS